MMTGLACKAYGVELIRYGAFRKILEDVERKLIIGDRQTMEKRL